MAGALTDDEVGLGNNTAILNDADVGLTPPPSPEQTTLGGQWQQFGQRVEQGMLQGARPATLAAGGLAGAAAALPVAPMAGPFAPAVPVVGGALGVAAASAGYDNISQVLQAIIPGFQPLPQATPNPTAASVGMRAADEGAFDAAVTAATGVVGFPVKHFITPLVGKIMGVRSQAAVDAANLAKSYGVELGAVDVGNQTPKIMSKVFGVFPVTGTPLRKFRNIKEQQLQNAVSDTLNMVAPTASISSEMGVDLLKAAQQADQRFTRVSGILYDKFRSYSGNLGAVIPTTETLGLINKWTTALKEGAIPVTAPGQGVVMQGLSGVAPAPATTSALGKHSDFENFLASAETALRQNQNQSLTMAQYEQLEKKLESFVDTANPDGFTLKRVVEIKRAMERDLNAIADPTAKSMKDAADTFFASGILKFQTPTAGKFARVDKNIFKAGPQRPGSLNPDELMKPVFDADSPIALQNLRELVGPEAFNRAARTHLETAMQDAWQPVIRDGKEMMVFDPDVMARKLGLGAGSNDKRKALETTLQGTGVQVSDMENLLKNIHIQKQADPSVFMARRVSLGGLAALSAIGGAGAAVTGGAGAGLAGALGSPLMTGLLTYASYNMSRLMASPQALKALTRAMQPNVDDLTRRAVYTRLIRELGDVREQQ